MEDKSCIHVLLATGHRKTLKEKKKVHMRTCAQSEQDDGNAEERFLFIALKTLGLSGLKTSSPHSALHASALRCSSVPCHFKLREANRCNDTSSHWQLATTVSWPIFLSFIKFLTSGSIYMCATHLQSPYRSVEGLDKPHQLL